MPNQETEIATLAEYREHWRTLHDFYVEANEMAREARGLVTAAYVAALAGNGAGPSSESIQHAERLESMADKLAKEARDIADKILGEVGA
ncbi:MAG: hypothetical protein DI603_17975 [Roseateles depolymerans]|uniref:Uncharacterized protein n=1 Tax=Roseateles depolymerans TaxID=76731 RepID=A0A2W5DKY4_9BURK|nr:MAG: hypothetical protein DI603_17975 [Roseateles depolymerans]